jgi:hypothetical protein
METETTTQTRAAVAVVTSDGYSIGFADEGVRGYTPTTYSYETYSRASRVAEMWNDLAGLSGERAAAIVLSSMAAR